MGVRASTSERVAPFQQMASVLTSLLAPTSAVHTLAYSEAA